jgi:hypothetical protein
MADVAPRWDVDTLGRGVGDARSAGGASGLIQAMRIELVTGLVDGDSRSAPHGDSVRAVV